MSKKIRLIRGENRDIQGPVTGIRYAFRRSRGLDNTVEVDDKDYEAFLNFKEGCCGMPKRFIFQKVEE